MYLSVFKRILDLLIASLLTIILLPVFFILAAISFLVNGGKVWFVQCRVGYNEREFKLYKFKTLLKAGTANGAVIEDPLTHKPMVLTGWGRFMRTYSLDEIPQLINVLLNDLSLVGPRPLLPEYLDYYNQQERKRHTVKAGITGLAQVNERSVSDWSQKLAFDIKYVENVSFSLDMKILAMTAWKWFRPRRKTTEISLIDYKKQLK